MGQIVVASYTGGNKYFAKYENSGIFLYNNNTEAENIISQIIKMSEEKRKELRKKNLELYKAEFTNEAFAKRYIYSLHKILG